MQLGHARFGRTLTSIAVALFVASCGSDPAPTQPGTADAPYLLQARINQALPPEELFGLHPSVTITADQILVVGGAVPAVFPGPLLPGLFGRTISPSGYDRIVSEARSAGLLEGDGGDDAPEVQPGAQLGEIDLWVDGELRTVRGDPNSVMQCIRAPCEAPPGAEAFGPFWQAIHDLGTLMPEELGPDGPFAPDAYALLVDVPPIDGGGIAPQVLQWPLPGSLADLGEPIAAARSPRCATIRGEDAATLGPALSQANQLTRWVDAGQAGGEGIVLRARALLPGENPCATLFGVGD